MKLLFKNADLYTPIHVGVVDILIDDGIIVNISKNINDKCNIIDCSGKIICPMLVDGHEHLKNTDFYNPTSIINSGVDTVVGVLASEKTDDDVNELINVTKKIKEEYGIKAYCLAGSKNFVNDITNYILNNDCVVGIKTALFSNERPKPNLNYEKLKKDSVSTYNAGKKSKKNVQVHIHLEHPFPKEGSANIDEINSGKLDNLGWIDKIVEECNIPYSLFKLTHAQKYYNRILEYANKGCYIDYTAFNDEYDNRYDFLVNAIKNNKVNLNKISISSDLGILSMEKNYTKKETPITIINTIQKLVMQKGLNLEDVLKMVTVNALAPIKKEKEFIKIGKKCNFIVLSKNIEIEKVYTYSGSNL